MQAVTSKQCSVGIQRPKCAKQTSPTLWQHQSEPLIQDRTDLFMLFSHPKIKTHQTRQRFPIYCPMLVSQCQLEPRFTVVNCCNSPSTSSFNVLDIQSCSSAYLCCNEGLLSYCSSKQSAHSPSHQQHMIARYRLYMVFWQFPEKPGDGCFELIRKILRSAHPTYLRKGRSFGLTKPICYIKVSLIKDNLSILCISKERRPLTTDSKYVCLVCFLRGVQNKAPGCKPYVSKLVFSFVLALNI